MRGNNSFANGVVAPKRAAAASAQVTPGSRSVACLIVQTVLNRASLINMGSREH